MSIFNSLTDDQLDVLKEIANIGSGNATTSLSILLKNKVEMEIPDLRVVDYNEMMDLVGGAETLIAAILLKFDGDVSGNIFFVLTPKEASHFVSQMTGDRKRSLEELYRDEMALSALQEVGNILTGSYLTALSDFIEILLKPSVPVLAIDMAGAILVEGLMELSQVSDYAIIIETIINNESVENSQLKGHFFFLPDPNALSIIFDKLGVIDQ